MVKEGASLARGDTDLFQHGLGGAQPVPQGDTSIVFIVLGSLCDLLDTSRVVKGADLSKVARHGGRWGKQEDGQDGEDGEEVKGHEAMA